jgi:hypothetical protein
VDLTDGAYVQHVLTRLTDYCKTEGILWTRRLWDVGSILALEELWEAGQWQTRKVLSPAAVAWQRAELRRLIGPDHGLGTHELRREVTRMLTSGHLTDPSPGHRRLRQVIDHAREGYLQRWARALRAGERVKPERLARTVASHLLDLGYTAPFLTERWISEMRGRTMDAIEIVDSAATLAEVSETTFDIILALDTIPHVNTAAQSPGWVTNAEISQWLKANNFSASGIRNGGFRYRISARDAYGAANQVRQIFERMVARSQFIRKDRGGLAAMPHLWVAGHPEPMPLLGPARNADILTLANLRRLYDVHDGRTQIDDALELAAPVNQTGAPAPAVAGAWAAIESLLCEPGDPVDDGDRSGKAVAADRLAAIVACSWPRAELTTLIHRHDAADELASKRQDCTTSHARAQLLALEIADAGTKCLDFGRRHTRYSDAAAAECVRALLAEPQRVLLEIKQAVQVALRRLYRARNVVLHGGSTSSVVLEATLRTAAPLVGAGLDRIAGHHFTTSMSPLDLAARAELAIDLVGGETGLSVVDLLEEPVA